MQYALQGLRGILEYDAAWPELSEISLERLLNILATATHANVLRPATAVVRRLVEEPRIGESSRAANMSSAYLSPKSAPYGSKGKGRDDAGVSNAFGFERVWQAMGTFQAGLEGSKAAEGILTIVVSRLEGQGDLELVSQR